MEFTPHLKRKRTSCKELLKLAPFPLRDDGQRYKGAFNGLCVEVVDAEHAPIRTLHDNGCYGKGSASRGGPVSGEADETLLLGLEEACLLGYYLGVLEIRDMLGNELSWPAYVQAALDCDRQFVYKLASYLYLKSKNWIIKSGIKFGGDFRKLFAGNTSKLNSASFGINSPQSSTSKVPGNITPVSWCWFKCRATQCTPITWRRI